jgi:hypothetical protein
VNRLLALPVAALVMLALVSLPTSTAAAAPHFHTVVGRFAPVGDPDLQGVAVLRPLKDGGAAIQVVAWGLEPDHDYVSLYYGNSTCELEPYSEEDVIGGVYTANRGGVGRTTGTADDDLDEILSVSVRDAETFDLLGCAVVPAQD